MQTTRSVWPSIRWQCCLQGQLDLLFPWRCRFLQGLLDFLFPQHQNIKYIASLITHMPTDSLLVFSRYGHLNLHPLLPPLAPTPNPVSEIPGSARPAVGVTQGENRPGRNRAIEQDPLPRKCCCEMATRCCCLQGQVGLTIPLAIWPTGSDRLSITLAMRPTG